MHIIYENKSFFFRLKPQNLTSLSLHSLTKPWERVVDANKAGEGWCTSSTPYNCFYTFDTFVRKKPNRRDPLWNCLNLNDHLPKIYQKTSPPPLAPPLEFHQLCIIGMSLLNDRRWFYYQPDYWSNKADKMMTMIDHYCTPNPFFLTSNPPQKQTMQQQHYSECKFRHRYIILPGKEKHFKKLIERKERKAICTRWRQVSSQFFKWFIISIRLSCKIC